MGLNVNNILDELWALYPNREQTNAEIAKSEELVQTLTGNFSFQHLIF